MLGRASSHNSKLLLSLAHFIKNPFHQGFLTGKLMCASFSQNWWLEVRTLVNCALGQNQFLAQLMNTYITYSQKFSFESRCCAIYSSHVIFSNKLKIEVFISLYTYHF